MNQPALPGCIPRLVLPGDAAADRHRADGRKLPKPAGMSSQKCWIGRKIFASISPGSRCAMPEHSERLMLPHHHASAAHPSRQSRPRANRVKLDALGNGGHAGRKQVIRSRGSNPHWPGWSRCGIAPLTIYPITGVFNLWQNVLFTDRSELGVEQRPVVVLVAQRPGSAEFGDGLSWRDDSPNMLANQAKFWGFCGSRRRGKRFSRRSAEVERAGGARAGAFHDVEVDHGGLMAAAAATLRAVAALQSISLRSVPRLA